MYFPAGRPLELWICGTLLLSLWATVTNAVPLSVTFAVMGPLIPYVLSRTQSVPRVIAALLLVYGVFLASTLAYAPSSLLDPTFYRRDGNFFVTYMPMMLGGLICLQIDIRRVVRAFVLWSTAITAVLVVIYMVTGGTIIHSGTGVFHALFEAHNAAGGFLASMVALSVGLLLNSKRKFFPWCAVVINSVALYLTVSRGSMLGIVLAVLLIVAAKGRYIRLVVAMIAVGTLLILAYTYPLWLEAGSPAGFWFDPVEGLDDQALNVDSNSVDRLLYLWPRAFYLFLQSPLIGAGFGSYNDLPYSLVGIPHLLSLNRPVELTFSSAHAHNSYLHILAECGLVGLLVVIVLLREMWLVLKAFPSGVREGLALAMWAAVFSSCTEHRLVTPSQMLPITILFGLCLANRRWEIRSGPSTHSP